MAQRIMYSVVPHLADNLQVALTNGVVDISALKAAVEGRKGIIKYGVKVVLDELSHYHQLGAQSKPWQICRSLIESEEYEEAMDVAIAAFQDPKAWASRYGGRAWEMIAKTLRQIIRLDKSLTEIRSKPGSADNQEKEIVIMRDLIVELNVFDGLAHNSDNVMKNLIDVETRETSEDTKQNVSRRKQQERSIKRLMDAKELDSPVEVYKRIQDTLHGSGDAIKFKDWINKMRRHQDYYKNDPDLTKKLFVIYLRKAVIPARTDLNSMRDKLSSDLRSLESGWSSYEYGQLVSELSVAWSEISIVSGELEEHVNMFVTHYPDLPDADNVGTTLIQPVTKKAKAIVDKMNALMQALEHFHEPETTDDKFRAVALCKECLSLLNHFSYLLDSL